MREHRAELTNLGSVELSLLIASLMDDPVGGKRQIYHLATLAGGVQVTCVDPYPHMS